MISCNNTYELDGLPVLAQILLPSYATPGHGRPGVAILNPPRWPGPGANRILPPESLHTALQAKGEPVTTTVDDLLHLKGPGVISSGRKVTIRDAVRVMAEANVGCVVIEENDCPIGIFTERDLMTRVVNADLDPDKTMLDEVMTWPVETCSRGETVHDCLGKLVCSNFRHLVVAEDGKLAGVISFRDLLVLEQASHPA